MRTLEVGPRQPIRPTTIGRRGLVVAIITMILSLAPGCAVRDTNEGGQPGTGARPLRLGVIDNLRSLSPLQNDGFDAGMLNSLVFSYLERTAPDGQLVPELVRAVPTRRNGGISADGRTITYRLRDDVRWQDGTPLTAADVVFTVRAIHTFDYAMSRRRMRIPSSSDCANAMPRSSTSSLHRIATTRSCPRICSQTNPNSTT